MPERKCPPEERIKAQNQLSGFLVWVILADIACFVLGPAIHVLYSVFVQRIAPDGAEIALVLLLNLAVGFSCAPPQRAFADIILRPERRKLGIHSLEGTRTDVSIGGRILLICLSSTFLAAVALAVAGYGAYADFSGVKGTVGAQALSLASAQQGGKSAVLLRLLTLVAGILVWSSVGFFATIKNLVSQIADLDQWMGELGSGSTDMTRRAAIGTNDELGRLTASFNAALSTFQGLIKQVKGLSSSVASTADTLGGYSSRSEESFGSFKEAAGRLNESIQAQTSSVAAGKGAVARMAESIETVSEQVSTQAGYVEQSSASIEEMVANIASVSKSAERADTLNRSLTELADAGQAVLSETVKGMAEIQEASASVGTIIGSISKIASQTNLLAMNAAIEAAHAGESGRGFSVVADEVRKLAETSAKSSREIIGLVKAMDQKIGEGARQAARAGEAFGNITSAVRDESELVRSIASSMAEQSQGAREILDSVKSLTDATESIKALAKGQRSQSAEMEAAMGDIYAKAASIGQALDGQTELMRELADLIGKVFAEAGRNKAVAQELDRSVSGFKA